MKRRITMFSSALAMLILMITGNGCQKTTALPEANEGMASLTTPADASSEARKYMLYDERGAEMGIAAIYRKQNSESAIVAIQMNHKSEFVQKAIIAEKDGKVYSNLADLDRTGSSETSPVRNADTEEEISYVELINKVGYSIRIYNRDMLVASANIER